MVLALVAEMSALQQRYRNALAVIVPTSSSKPATAAPARSKDLFDMEELRPKQPMRSQRDSNRSSQRESQGQQHQQQQQQEKTIKVLVPTWMSEEIRIDDEQSRPLWEILSIHVTDISAILKEKIPFDGNDSRQSQETIYAKAAQKLRALQATAESAFPTVDPVKYVQRATHVRMLPFSTDSTLMALVATPET